MPSKHKRMKGIVGIEAAIVLIAFVIVAAALAFVVLNMGFTTTQKSKETMQSGLKEASSALEVDGTVLGKVDTTSRKVTIVAMPLKLATGKNPIDINKTSVTIVYYDGSDWKTTTVKLAGKVKTGSNAKTDITQASVSTNDAEFHIYQGDSDVIFEGGEKAILYVGVNAPAYAKIMVEIKPPVGAPLTFEATVPPNLSDEVIVLS